MSLEQETRNLEEAVRRVDAARANLYSQMQAAQRALEANSVAWANVRMLESSTARLIVTSQALNPFVAVGRGISYGAYAGVVRALSGPVGVAARLVEQARRTMTAQVAVVEQQSRSLPEAVRQALDRKTAEWVARTLHAAAAKSAQVRQELTAYLETRWGHNDPAEHTALLGPSIPGVEADPAAYADGIYRLLVGNAYADQHPLPSVTPEAAPRGGGGGSGLGSIGTILSLGAGVVGAILIIKWLRERE